MWGMWLGAEKNPDDSEPISLGSFWGQAAIGTNKKKLCSGREDKRGGDGFRVPTCTQEDLFICVFPGVDRLVRSYYKEVIS